MSVNWTKKQMKSNRIHLVIKEFETMFPDQFEKTDIKKCDKCQGGFKRIEAGYEVKSNICEKCKGLGYYGFDTIYTEIVCMMCHGAGCQYCDNGLVTNWLDKVMRPDKVAAQKRANEHFPF